MELTPELQAQIKASLEFVQDAAKQSATFVADQAPDIVQQILRYDFVHHVTMCFIIMIATIFIGWFAWICFKKGSAAKDECHFDGDFWFVGGFFTALTVPCGMALTFLLALKAVEIWIAPKVYLLEYASSLLK